MFRMVWSAARPHGETAGLPLEGGQAEPAAQGFGLDSLEPAAQPLGPNHVEQMLALTALTQPGPFGPRTIELGDYIGAFEGERLIAMAGERAEAGPYREISGVCTHPDAQGRGWARRLMQILIARQRQRGQTPFLHVMRENTLARQLYQRMGFHDHCETVVRVIARS
jgi:ribosomal protein S18 acetylase RimI-like enzyme